MLPRVNYLIACSSHRVSKAPIGGIRGEDTLRLHIQELLKTDTSALAQVTILRALPLARDGTSEGLEASTRYWDIEALTKQLKCPCVNLDVQDAYFSYSSWIKAVQKYREQFDYYILIEDDYYPSLYNFASQLADLHNQKLPKGGYLCSYVYKGHAAVSNGIVDSVTFCRAIDKFPDPLVAISEEAQRRFLAPHVFGNDIADWTDTYRTLFWGGANKLVQLTNNPGTVPGQDVFNPVQYLVHNQRSFS